MKRVAPMALVAALTACSGAQSPSRAVAVATPDQPFRYQAPPLGPLTIEALRGVRATTLPNGLRVVVAEFPEATTVAMQLVNRRGGDDHERDRPGLAGMTAKAVAAVMGRCETPERCVNGPTMYAVDHRASRFYGTVEPGAIGAFTLRVALGLRRFDVSPSSFGRLVDASADERANGRGNDPLTDAVPRQMFDDGTLFNALVGGTPEEMRRLRYEAAEALFHARYTPSECALIAAGRTTLLEVLAYAERLLGPWQGAAAPAASARPATLREGGDRVLLQETADQPQARVLFTVPIRTETADARASARLLATVLASSFASRVQRALRLERGSAYSVNAEVGFYGTMALLVIESSIENARVGESLRTVRDAVDAAAREGITAEEFERARRATHAHWRALLDTPEGVAAVLLENFIERRTPEEAPPDWITALDALTLDATNRFLRAELSSSRARLFVRGDASALWGDLEGFGWGRVARLGEP